jgi:hypothetical protein
MGEWEKLSFLRVLCASAVPYIHQQNMEKIHHFTAKLLSIGVILSTASPVAAQNVTIINNSRITNQRPSLGSFIYGSPIPTPMPVNPRTGLMLNHSDRDYNSYPVIMPPGSSNPLLPKSTFINPPLTNYSRPSQTLRRPGQLRMNRSQQRRPSTGQTPLMFNYIR